MDWKGKEKMRNQTRIETIIEDLNDVMYVGSCVLENSWASKEDKDHLKKMVEELNELISREEILPLAVLELIDFDLFTFENKKLDFAGNLSLRMQGKTVRY